MQEVLRAVSGGQVSESIAAIVVRMRLPRVLLASIVGAGLGSAGAGYQGLFRNPLADPFVIGASSGAALGATLAIIGLGHFRLLGLDGVQWYALLGAVAAVGVVYAIAVVGGQTPTVSLLLAGVAVSSFASGLVSLLMFLNAEKLATIFAWLMGSFTGAGWEECSIAAVIVGLGIVALWCHARILDVLCFGEETASAMGLNLHLVRGSVVIVASLITAACVSITGLIGFIGLVAPHIARFFVGPAHTRLIPASCLVGAILLLCADDVARTISPPNELPVGVIAAVIGAPFFSLPAQAASAAARG